MGAHLSRDATAPKRVVMDTPFAGSFAVRLVRRRVAVPLLPCFVGAALPVAALPIAAGAQQPAALKGRVLVDADGRAVAGADIRVGAALIATSDSLGRFLVASIPPGKQEVSIRRVGYAPIRAIFTFAVADTIEGEFRLVPAATTTLPGVEVRGLQPEKLKLKAFEARRAAGFGNFLTEEQIDRGGRALTSDVMRQMPGPQIIKSPNSFAAWVSTGRGSMATVWSPGNFDQRRGARQDACYATVYVDGIAVFSALPGEGLFDVNSLPPSTIGGIEFYASSAVIPSELPQKRGTCGVLAIWTRV